MTAEPIKAHSLAVDVCPHHGQLHIELLDRDGQIVAVANIEALAIPLLIGEIINGVEAYLCNQAAEDPA